MARSELEFSARFFRGFGDVRAAARNVSKVMGKLKTPLRKDLLEHARAQESPDGTWEPRESKSQKRAAKRKASVKRGRKRKASKTRGARQAVSFVGGGTLLGELPDKTVVRKRGAAVEARNPVPWSGVHNEGGRVGNTADIPARPHVFISPAIETLASNLLADHLVMAWGD